MLTPESKVRFYHIPKSGGTTVFKLTHDWSNFKRAHRQKNHVPISYFPPDVDEIGMAVLRHPYSRFISAFYHMVDACNPNFYYRNASQSDCESLNSIGIYNFGELYRYDPNEFLYRLDRGDTTTKKIWRRFDIFRSQFYWLSDIFGLRIHPGVKMTLRQENLQNEFDDIARQLGHHVDWGNSYNVRITQNSVPLTEQSKKILRKFYEKDFRHFDFETDILIESKQDNPIGVDNPAWGWG